MYTVLWTICILKLLNFTRFCGLQYEQPECSVSLQLNSNKLHSTIPGMSRHNTAVKHSQTTLAMTTMRPSPWWSCWQRWRGCCVSSSYAVFSLYFSKHHKRTKLPDVILFTQEKLNLDKVLSAARSLYVKVYLFLIYLCITWKWILHKTNA